jgi:hypothetical protein
MLRKGVKGPWWKPGHERTIIFERECPGLTPIGSLRPAEDMANHLSTGTRSMLVSANIDEVRQAVTKLGREFANWHIGLIYLCLLC